MSCSKQVSKRIFCQTKKLPPREEGSLADHSRIAFLRSMGVGSDGYQDRASRGAALYDLCRALFFGGRVDAAPWSWLFTAADAEGQGMEADRDLWPACQQHLSRALCSCDAPGVGRAGCAGDRDQSFVHQPACCYPASAAASVVYDGLSNAMYARGCSGCVAVVEE